MSKRSAQINNITSAIPPGYMPINPIQIVSGNLPLPDSFAIDRALSPSYVPTYNPPHAPKKA